MKRLLFLTLFFFVVTLNLSAQLSIFKISEGYFRSSPFEKEFSQFLTHLLHDPTLTEKKVTKKTDSTLFFMEGIYKSHNPFFFKSIKARIILAEKNEVTDDSLGTARAIYVYQLVGYAPANPEGAREVEEEYEKFCRRYKRTFAENNYKEFTNSDRKHGEIRDFLYKNMDFVPVTVAWATSKDNTENIFALTIRFRVGENRAYVGLPIPLNGF